MEKLLILTRFPAEYEPKRSTEAAARQNLEAKIVNYEKIGEFGDFERLRKIDYLLPRSSAHRSRKSLVRLKTRILKQLPPPSDLS